MKRIPDDKQKEFQSKQKEIYPLLASALLKIIPEHWTSADLDLITGKEEIAHSISNKDGNKDIVTPSMELFTETRKLELLFREYDCMWAKAKFKVYWNESVESWDYSIDYQY